jgi:thioredoxin reductase (NADPH)
MDYRRLNLPTEDRLSGVGVYYGAGAPAGIALRQCPSVRGRWWQFGCPGRTAFRALCREGDDGGQGRVAHKNLSHYLVGRIVRAAPQIEVLLSTEVTAIEGDALLRKIALRDNSTGKTWTAETNWLFVRIGGVPHTRWAADVGIRRDDAGFIIAGPDLLKNGALPREMALNRRPYDLETSIPGIFAAGDVRHGSIKRCASAVGVGQQRLPPCIAI